MTLREGLEEAKMFTWYLATQPWRVARETFREVILRQVENARTLKSYKTWAMIFFGISLATLAAGDRRQALGLLLAAAAFYLLYEWTSKRYRYEWKQSRLRRIKANIKTEEQP